MLQWWFVASATNKPCPRPASFLSWANDDCTAPSESCKPECVVVKKETIENPISTQRATPAANANVSLQTALSNRLQLTLSYGAPPRSRSRSDRVLTFCTRRPRMRNHALSSSERIAASTKNGLRVERQKRLMVNGGGSERVA